MMTVALVVGAIALVIAILFFVIRPDEIKVDTRTALLETVESKVLNRLNIQDNEFTEMLNVYLRDKYAKPRMDNWLEMTEEEIRKVLRQYGGMKRV